MVSVSTEVTAVVVDLELSEVPALLLMVAMVAMAVAPRIVGPVVAEVTAVPHPQTELALLPWVVMVVTVGTLGTMGPEV